MTVPAIQVFTFFPRSVLNDGDEDLDVSNWHRIHGLDFPIERLNEFSVHPYKWVRYGTGVVVGAEGHLSLDPNSPNQLDYNATPTGGTEVVYYHVTDEERRRMCPVDPNCGYRAGIYPGAESRREINFHDKISRRDGQSCVLTGLNITGCQAAHLLAHSKGDEYIKSITRGRSRDPNHGDVIHQIDDIRNGLFLSASLHQGMRQDIAFLPTPNFALDTPDVDPTDTALPGERRYTTHGFVPNALSLLQGLGRPSGTPLEISGTPDWPPAIVFDILYGITVIKHFGTETLKDSISSVWTKRLYPDGYMTRAEADFKKLNDGRAEEIARSQRQKDQRKDRAIHRHLDAGEILALLPYMLLSTEHLREHLGLRAAEERAENVEETCV